MGARFPDRSRHFLGIRLDDEVGATWFIAERERDSLGGVRVVMRRPSHERRSAPPTSHPSTRQQF
jgi:hypothetical protein